jgi:GNAT superfamily N-acetyltransferase
MNQELFKIRQGQPADAPAIADVFLTARSRCLPYLPRVHSDEQTRQWIADVVSRLPELWVAEINDRVVGFAAVIHDFLEHLYVHPDFHGRGIGSALLKSAKEARPDGFTLWLFQQNAQARRFYERHGLLLLRETDGSGNEERTPDAEYQWTP